MKGRIYLGGFATNADAGGGIPSPAAVTGMQGFATGLFNALSAQGLTASVGQPPRNSYMGVTGTTHAQRGSLNPSTGTHIPVTSYTFTDQRWNSQRRRAQP